MSKSLRFLLLIYGTSLLILYLFTFVEIGLFKVETITQPTLWIALAIFGTFEYRKLKGSKSAIRKSLAGLALLLLCITGPFYIASKFLFGYSGDTPIFRSKYNKNVELIGRSYGCYLTDESLDIYKVRFLTPHIKFVYKYREEKIDLTQYERIVIR